MTCKDCVHCEVCGLKADVACEKFKDKSTFVQIVLCKDCGKRYTKGCPGWCGDNNYIGATTTTTFGCHKGVRKELLK